MRKIIYKTLTNRERNSYIGVDLLVSIFVCFLFFLIARNSLDHYIFSQILYAENDLKNNGLSMDVIDQNELQSMIYTLCHIISFIFIWVTYTIIMSFFIGYTLGSHLFDIKLVDIFTNKEASLKQRLIRGIITIIDCFFLLGLGSMYVFFNDERLTLADKIAKTKVASMHYIKVNNKKSA